MYPTIFHATHITRTSRSLIDNFFTYSNQSWESGVLNCDLSDHETIFLCINRPIIHLQPSSCMYKHVVTKKIVNFISLQRFDFVTDTS